MSASHQQDLLQLSGSCGENYCAAIGGVRGEGGGASAANSLSGVNSFNKRVNPPFNALLFTVRFSSRPIYAEACAACTLFRAVKEGNVIGRQKSVKYRAKQKKKRGGEERQETE